MKGRAPFCTATGVVLGGSLAALYVWKVRRWMATWGTKGDEASRSLPGDEHVLEPMVQATRAVTFGAPPEEVWPCPISTCLTSGSPL